MFENTDTVFFYKMNEQDQLAANNKAIYFPYKQGYIYEQDGATRHQITCGGDVLKNERRITIQGHLLETEKEIIIYV